MLEDEAPRVRRPRWVAAVRRQTAGMTAAVGIRHADFALALVRDQLAIT